jgi:hypothetical protein
MMRRAGYTLGAACVRCYARLLLHLSQCLRPEKIENPLKNRIFTP